MQKRRVLYYPTTDDRLFDFNVDTRANTEIDVGGNVGIMPSFTRIDRGLKELFQNIGGYVYTLNMDSIVTQLGEKQNYDIMTLFPSTSNAKIVDDAVFMNRYDFMKGGKRINTNHLIKFYWCSLVRVYRDVFSSL